MLLAAIMGALHRYLQEPGDPLHGAEFRATIPVDMRTPSVQGELGNRIGVYLLDLPVGTADPVTRLQVLKQRMDRVKETLEAEVIYAGLRAIGRLSPLTQKFLTNWLEGPGYGGDDQRAGASGDALSAGVPLDVLPAGVPKAGGLGIGVSILSYAGQVRLGVITDID